MMIFKGWEISTQDVNELVEASLLSMNQSALLYSLSLGRRSQLEIDNSFDQIELSPKSHQNIAGDRLLSALF